MRFQRRLVAHEPLMPEWIDETTLAVRAPRHLVSPYRVNRPVGASLYGPSNESTGLVAEHFHAA